MGGPEQDKKAGKNKVVYLLLGTDKHVVIQHYTLLFISLFKRDNITILLLKNQHYLIHKI